jgi:hypothetical protein
MFGRPWKSPGVDSLPTTISISLSGWAKAANLIGFQLCYDKSGDEHALTWHKKTGFDHHRVDSGELQRPYKATPILVADGGLDFAGLIYLFKERSRKMDQQAARFVLGKIEGIQPELKPH